LKEPTGFELPPKGFAVEDAGFQARQQMEVVYK
jgi:hypothetical protein